MSLADVRGKYMLSLEARKERLRDVHNILLATLSLRYILGGQLIRALEESLATTGMAACSV